LRSFCEAQYSAAAAAAAAAAATLVRNRSALVNLAPTSTGSATAIALIFPELKGKLNGLAVRVPLTNSSITDCVFEVRCHLVSHR
jgi:glyceraldehyde-3-phosphate dehydrogenase/erythrose-4-phosphate dehydrogenase